jgi:hypothetical protein
VTTETDGLQNGHDHPMKEKYHQEKINEDGLRQTIPEETVHETVHQVHGQPAPQDKTVETKDMTDETREDKQIHGHEQIVIVLFDVLI